MIKKTLIFVYLFVLINGQEKNCGPEEMDKIDKCFLDSIILGDTIKNYTSTYEELEIYCTKTKKNEKYLRDFIRNCLNKVTKQIAGLIVKGIKTFSKSYCIKEKNSLELSKCVNPDIKKDHMCMIEYVQDLKKIFNDNKPDKSLPGVCCTFHKFESCIIDKIVISDKCNKSIIDRYRDYINKISGEAIEFSCLDFKKNKEKCLDVINYLNKLPKVNLPGKTIIRPLIGILNNLL